MLLFKMFICMQLALYFIFGAILYFPIQLNNIKMEILNLIESTFTMDVNNVVSTESELNVESTDIITSAEIQNSEAIINEIIPSAAMLRPYTVCTTTSCGTCENETIEGGILASPDYPIDYGSDRACIYTIRASGDQKIQLTFTVFHVEFQYDWIDVYDGTSVQISPNITLGSSLTGYDLPRDRNSTLNVMTIHFVSDLDNTEIPLGKTGQWQAKYKVI